MIAVFPITRIHRPERGHLRFDRGLRRGAGDRHEQEAGCAAAATVDLREPRGERVRARDQRTRAGGVCVDRRAAGGRRASRRRVAMAWKSCDDALSNCARKFASVATADGAISVGLNPSVGSNPVGFITKFTFDVAVTKGTITLSDTWFVRPISSASGLESTLSRTCTCEVPSDAVKPGIPESERMLVLNGGEVFELSDADRVEIEIDTERLD